MVSTELTMLESVALGFMFSFIFGFLVIYYTTLVVRIQNRELDNRKDLILSFLPFYIWVKHLKDYYKELK